MTQPENEIVMQILHRIGEQPEFKEVWKSLPNAERNYLCGDLYNIIYSRPHLQAPCPELSPVQTEDGSTEWICNKESIARTATLAVLDELEHWISDASNDGGWVLRKIESIRQSTTAGDEQR